MRMLTCNSDAWSAMSYLFCSRTGGVGDSREGLHDLWYPVLGNTSHLVPIGKIDDEPADTNSQASF